MNLKTLNPYRHKKPAFPKMTFPNKQPTANAENNFYLTVISILSIGWGLSPNLTEESNR